MKKNKKVKIKRENTPEGAINALMQFKKQIKKLECTNYEKKIIMYIVDYILLEVFDIQGEYYTKNSNYPVIEDYIDNNDYFDDRMDINYFAYLIIKILEAYSYVEILLTYNLKDYFTSIGKDKVKIFDILTKIWDYTISMTDIFFKIQYKLEEHSNIQLAIEDIVTEIDGKTIELLFDNNDEKLVRTIWKKFREGITQSELEESKLIERLPNVIENLQKIKIKIKDSEILKYNKDKLLYYLDMMIDELNSKNITINIKEEVSKFNNLEKELVEELLVKRIEMPKDEFTNYLSNQIFACANLHYLIRKGILYYTIEDVPSLKIDCSRMQIIENILNTFICANVVFLCKQKYEEYQIVIK